MGFFRQVGNALVRFMYGRNGMDQLNRALLLLYLGICVLRMAALGVIVWGVYSKVQLVWDAADAAMAIMASINLVAIVMLSGAVVKLTRDYDRQLDAGRVPRFEIDGHPGLAKGVDREIWG